MDGFENKVIKEDIGERCETWDTLGNQCESHKGHKGLHRVRWFQKFWKHDYNLKKVKGKWRAKKRR